MAVVANTGSGGREAALAYGYGKNIQVDKIAAIPGTDFLEVSTSKPVERIPLAPTDIDQFVLQCKQRGITLVDVSQDNAVEAGLVDKLTEAGIASIGPTRAAGRIEWDKVFARKLGEEIGLPQPQFHVFTSREEGINYIVSHDFKPCFIKASGLARGQGAIPAKTPEEAIRAINQLKRFGKAGETYLIEEWIRGDNDSTGEEFSAFAVCDGEHWKPFQHYAQDNKRVNEGDTGENTGGMGCHSPILLQTPEIEKQVNHIFESVFRELARRGTPYKGILYLGGMVVEIDGEKKVFVVEFNARWGDPEAQVIVPSINDLYGLSMAVNERTLDTFDLSTDGVTRITVALTADGYPGDFQTKKGRVITGIDEVLKLTGIKIYGAGIKRSHGNYVIDGGRVLHIVAEGNDIIQARESVYAAIQKLGVEGSHFHFRRDIGGRDASRFTTSVR